MKRTIPLLLIASLALGSAAPATDAPRPFDNRERAVLRDICADVSAWLRDADLPADMPLSVLRIGGDRSNWLLDEIKNAASDAGLNYVEGRGDPLWNAIIDEIEWDELKDDMLDETTLTRLGRLQAVRLFLYGRLLLETTDDGRPRAELTLHVTRIETKQHLRGRSFVREEAPPPPTPDPIPELVFVDFPVALVDVPLAVCVRAEAADAWSSSRSLADDLATDAAGTLAQAGFSVVPDSRDAEAIVSIRTSAPAFAREQGYVVFDGDVELSASLPSDRNRVLGATKLTARGARGLGDTAALRNLRRNLGPAFREWLSATVDPDRAGIRKATLQIDFATPSETERRQLATTLLGALRELPAVRDARVVSELPPPDGASGCRVSFAVSFRAAELPEGLVPALVAKRPDLFRRTVQSPAPSSLP